MMTKSVEEACTDLFLRIELKLPEDGSQPTVEEKDSMIKDIVRTMLRRRYYIGIIDVEQMLGSILINKSPSTYLIPSLESLYTAHKSLQQSVVEKAAA